MSSAACTSSPGISAWSVAKCCSASVSVGAISAAWPPDSTARSIAYSATTVLPEPTSPIRSRCIGRSRSSVGVDGLHRLALVAGRGERQRVLEPARGQLAGRLQRRGARALAAARATAQQRHLQQQHLLVGEPAAAALVVAEVGGEQRGGAVRQLVVHAQARRAAAPAPRAPRRRAGARARGSASTRGLRSPGRSRRRPPARRPPRRSRRGTGRGSGCGPRTCR